MKLVLEPRSTCVESRRLWIQAQTDYARSRYDYMMNMLKLQQAAGTLSEQSLEPAEHPAQGSAAAARSPRPTAPHSTPLACRQPTDSMSASSRTKLPRLRGNHLLRACAHLPRADAAIRRITVPASSHGQVVPHPSPALTALLACNQATLQPPVHSPGRGPVITGIPSTPQPPADCARRRAPNCRRRTPRPPPHTALASSPTVSTNSTGTSGQHPTVLAAAALEPQASPIEQLRHRLEALRMPGHQQQQRVRPPGACNSAIAPSVSQVLLSGMRAAGDPDRPRIPANRRVAQHRMRRLRSAAASCTTVELQIAHPPRCAPGPHRSTTNRCRIRRRSARPRTVSPAKTSRNKRAETPVARAPIGR